MGNFRSTLVDAKKDQSSWLNHTLKFHIDSAKAFDINRKAEERGASGFENFVTGGDLRKKYAHAYEDVKAPDLGADVEMQKGIEDIVSMQELINLATREEKPSKPKHNNE